MEGWIFFTQKCNRISLGKTNTNKNISSIQTLLEKINLDTLIGFFFFFLSFFHFLSFFRVRQFLWLRGSPPLSSRPSTKKTEMLSCQGGDSANTAWNEGKHTMNNVADTVARL